ncbi:MAG TPA: AraC family transcriptional regulator [Thermoanaerobaculia bacterium]|jgi:AraC-like DNA-binding protein
MSTLTYGDPLDSFATADARITDVRYGAGDTYRRHAHPFGYLLLVRSGGFAENGDELSSGDVVAVPPEFPHHDVIGALGARGLLVTFAAHAWRPSRWRAFHGGDVSRAMIALHRDLQLGAGEALAIEEQLLETIARIAHEKAERIDARAVRIARELIESESAQPLRLGEVARRAGVTAAHLARTFRRATGRTMGAQLRAARARRAAAMLASTGAGAAEIALASGFADQSHLSRVFKSEYGLTPRRYRQLMRASNPFKI